MSRIQGANSLVELLCQRALETPDQTAFIFLSDGSDSDERITYGELNARARTIAVHLQTRLTAVGEPVLLLFPPGIEYICVFFACLYAGAVPVPAYPPTSARQLPRLQAIINDAKAKIAFTTVADLQRISMLERKTERLSGIQWLLIDALPESTELWIDPQLDLRSLAFLQYTSGSTSAPKGVMVSQGNLFKNLECIGERLRAQDGDVVLFWLPPYHDFGLIGGICYPVVWGAVSVLMRPASFLLNPYRWLEAIGSYGARITGAPNFAYDLCVQKITDEQKSQIDLSGLRAAFNGAEPIREATLKAFSEAFAPCGFKPEAWLPAYGLAESTLMVSGRLQDQAVPEKVVESLNLSRAALERNEVETADEGDCISLISSGPVLSQHKVEIVNPTTMALAGPNEVGEIWVHGPSVAQGYWRREEQTAEAFAARIAGSTGEAYMRTGDLGFLRDGELYICGRSKDLIIIRGKNLYPQDIELASFKAHEKLRVDGAVVFSVEHEGTERLVIAQELEFRATADESLFGVIASAVLEQVGMPPDVVLLLKPGSLPRTSSGKVQRQLTKKNYLDGKLTVLANWERLQAGKPMPVAEKAEPVTAEPAIVAQAAMPAQAEIATLLRMQLAIRLGMPADDIDSTQPFAYYGLDSVMSVEMAHLLGQLLKCQISPTVFWDFPNIDMLARHLAQESGIPAAATDAHDAVEEESEDIAIIGIACRFPGADDVEAYWHLLERGVNAVREVTDERLNAGTFVSAREHPSFTSIAGFLENVDHFDARFFGIAPVEAGRMDPQQRLVLEVAWQALEDAGIAASGIAGSKTGVFVGISTYDYGKLQAHANDGLNVYSATGGAASIAANRLSYLLDLRGPSLAIDTACSSSLVAVHQACQSLRSGESSMAFAGGVNLILSSDSGAAFAQAGMLSPDGICKTFDAGANGYVRGEGCGMLVLKRLGDAVRDGDPIRALISGSAVGQDGRTNGLVAPNGNAQAVVIREAIENAGIAPTEVSLIESHGTGTLLGDPIELNALKSVFLPGRAEGSMCVVGAVKSNIGHLEAAAGVAGLLKVVLSLQNKLIPPNLHYRAANPHSPLEGKMLAIPTTVMQWGADVAERYAGVSSFGFGGTLAHVVLQQAPKQDVAITDVGQAPWQLLTFSAKSEFSLERMSEDLARSLRAEPQLNLADVAYTHQTGRNAFPIRRMLVSASAESAARALATLDGAVIKSGHASRRAASVVFMFPGQGTQMFGAARELYQHVPQFRQEIDQCAELLLARHPYDIRALLGLADAGAEEEVFADLLQQTQYAQPALFALEYALARLWMHYGVKPAAMIGHSLGEYVAACIAGVFALEDALELVAARGELMQAQPPGLMLSVLLSEDEVATYLGADVSLAAVNGPQRCVLAGSPDAIETLERAFNEQGISSRRMRAAHAFHSHMMDGMLERFSALVEGVTLKAPALPFLSNLTGAMITSAEAMSTAYWVRHLREPVRFAEGLAALAKSDLGVTVSFIEAGPGNTLAGLVRQFANSSNMTGWNALASLAGEAGQASDYATHLSSLGQLWLQGHQVNWAELYQGRQVRRVHLPTYAFERQRYWIDATIPTSYTRTAAGHPVTQQKQFIAEHQNMSPTNAQAQSHAHASNSAFAASRKSRIQETILGIISELLHIDAAQIDQHAALLELGADSLILVQAVRKIEAKFAITLSIRQLFEELSTIASLVDFVDANMPAVPTEAGVALPPKDTAARVIPMPVPVMHADHQHAHAAPSAPLALADSESALERVIARQIDGLNQITQVMMQQLTVMGAQTAATPAQAKAEPGTQAALKQAAAHTATHAAAKAKSFAPVRQTQFDPYLIVTVQQDYYLQRFIRQFAERTQGSKSLTAKYRPVLADYRARAGFRFSASDPVLPLSLKDLFYPLVAGRSSGAHIWDVDGNEYVDLTMGFGVHLFGHNPLFVQDALTQQIQLGMQIGPQSPMAGEVAELVHQLTGMERVAFCNSGTEAVMLAMRLARTATGRKKVAMFLGSYHGWADASLLGTQMDGEEPGAASPLMPGLQPDIEKHALMLDYGSKEALDVIRAHAHDMAAVVVEPIQGRHPELQPVEFLRELRALTTELDIPLIFDEMITGFRLHPAGAQGLFGIRADIATYGKAAGGGMPLGIVAGAARFMDGVDGGQLGTVSGVADTVPTTFFAGTFSKHPLAMAAAKAVMQKLLLEGASLQEALTRRTTELVERLNRLFSEQDVAMHIVQCGSLFRLNTLQNLDLYCYHLVMHGIYIWEGRNMFLSTAHTDADIDRIYRAFETSIHDLRRGGFFAPLPVTDNAPAGRGVAALHSVTAQTHEVSTAQRRLLLLNKLDPASTAHHVPALIELAGVHRAEVEQALTAIVARHESLRTVFVDSEESLPRQRILDEFSVAVLERAIASEEELRTHVKRFSAYPFDLAKGPLFRCEFLQTWDGRQLLAWCMHEIIADGTSAVILEREVMTLLGGAGVEALPALPLQYKDYAAWQSRMLASHESNGARGYWHEQFAVAVPRLQLPFDAPLTSITPTQTAIYQFSLSGASFDAVKLLSKKQRVTLFMLLQASLSVWLARLTGEDDIVFATPVAGRELAEVEPLIGFFLNTVLLRTQVSADARFDDVLTQSRKIALDALEHQQYPFEQLLEDLSMPRPVNQFPVTPLLFNVLNYLDKQMPLAEQAAHHRAVDFDAKVELALTVQEHSNALSIECQYRTALFKPETIEYLMGQWLSLLQQVSVNSALPVGELALFDGEQARKLASPYLQFISPAPLASEPESVLARLRRLTKAQPEALALTWQDEQWTYAELEKQSERVAGHLQKLGCQAGDIVALLLENPLSHVAAVLGTMKAGAVFVTLDAADPEAKLLAQVERVAPRWWVAEEGTRSAFAALNSESGLPRLGIWLGAAKAEGSLKALAAQAKASEVKLPAHAPCYIFFTSGSTGTPKPILGSITSLSHFIDWEINAFGLDASCRVSQLTAPTFDAFLRDLFVPLCCGGMLCLPPTRKMAPDQMLNWLEEASVTLVHCVPSVLRALLAYQNLEPGFLNNTLPALQRICMSGEVLLPATVQAWHDLFGDRIELVNFYGASETTMIRCHHRITAADVAQGYIPVGKPIADTHIIVLDHSGKPCPTGTPGEIHVSSPYFSLGYYKDDAATAQVFVPNPLAKNSQSKVYRSGDMGVMSVDGTLRFLGRRDGLVKINGVRVEIGEIENALLGHPEVAEAAVIAQSAEDGATSLHAYVVGAVGIAEILRPYLTTKLSSALVPHNIVQLDALPMTGSGKVDRKALGAQVMVTAPATQSYVAPQTPVQETLAQLYADVLGRDKVSIHDDFFALGGHSLKALTVLARIRKTFKLELLPRTLFETPTVAGLAKRIEDAQSARDGSGDVRSKERGSAIERVAMQAAYEVSSAQRRLWLLHKLDSASTAHHVPALIQLNEKIGRDQLEQVLSLVVARHESLRTVFVEDEASLLLQRIEPAAPVVLNERNIASEEELRVFAWQYTTTPFDLTSGPLYRGEVLNTWDGRRLLAWCMHEIIADGMSAVILEREVMALLADENSAALPALPVQYKDFAAWQNRLLGADSNHASRNHWHQQFATEVPRLQLPFDHALTATTTTQAQKYRQIVSGPAFERIKTLCRERQVTLFMLLQASLSAWLTRLTGEQDVVFAIPVAGREQADVEALIGFFLNTVLLRTQVDPAESFNALLARSKDIALEALQHQQYPFEQLIEDLSLPRPANQFPVTPVLFNVLNFLDEQLPLEHEGARHETVDRDVKVELEFTVQEHSNALSFQCQYRSALFKPETIEYLMEQWLALLQQVALNGETTIAELTVFSDEQAVNLNSPYLQFALPASNLVEPESVLARLRRISKAQPDAIALTWEEEQWTYAELDKQSERVTGHLQKLGCQAGEIVALLLENPLSHVAAVLGTMKAGAVFVTLDAADPEAKLRAQIERVAPRWWIAEESTRSTFSAINAESGMPHQGIWFGAGKAEGSLKALAAQAKASEVKLPAPRAMLHLLHVRFHRHTKAHPWQHHQLVALHRLGSQRLRA